MGMSDDEIKEAILQKSTKSPKPALYIKDFYKCDLESKPRKIKNLANDLVKEGKMMFWSSGSTTMYTIPGRIKDEEGTA